MRRQPKDQVNPSIGARIAKPRSAILGERKVR